MGRRWPDRVASADALLRAYELHATALLRLCVLLAGRRDVAEELVQETFTRAAGALNDHEPDAVRPYLRTVAWNLWRNRLRRMAVEQRLRVTSTPREEISFEERDALWAAIRHLPPRQRACVVLRYYEDLSERETAETLRCSVGTVKSQTSRALERLRKEMGHANRG